MTPTKLILLSILALLGAPAALAAAAGGTTITVVEYVDTGTGRFFMTADPVEQEALDTTAIFQTPLRVRSGLQFDVFRADVDTCESSPSGDVCAVPVRRFNYNAFDWFFYSPKPADWAQLNQPDSGFTDAGVAFRAFLPVGGVCTQGRVAVYRSYRNQNHRFPGDQAMHQRMVTTGSEDEGIGFCAESARILPLFDATFTGDERAGVRTELECLPEIPTGSCLMARTLQRPAAGETAYGFGEVPQAYVERTGFNGIYVITEGAESLADRAFGTFVQFGNPGQVGLHVGTVSRTFQGPPAGLDVVYNLNRHTNVGNVDKRLQPFLRAYDVPVELSTRFQLFVNAVDPDGNSRVRGRLRFVLLDNSERRLDFVAEIYGNRDPVDEVIWEGGPNNFLNPGHGVVTTSIAAKTFGQLAVSLPYLSTVGTFRATNPWGYGAAFDYRIDALALQRIVDAARTLYPMYSPDASEYQVLSFRIENEIDGTGRLGLNARDITMQLLRRP
jgi:hypothetical protein